jgi:hypothetical protein
MRRGASFLEMEMAYVCLGMEMSYRWFGMGDAIAFWGWRERSRSAQTQETGFFRSPLPRHRYLVQKPYFSALSCSAQTKETGFFRSALPRHRYLVQKPYFSALSRSAQTQETGFFRSPLPRHRYLVQKPGFSPEPYRALPKPKKPGFFDHLCLDTDILSKNPISQPYRALPKPKKPGFFDPLCLDTDILVKTRFLTRAVSRSAQTKETGFFRSPLPRHRYLVQKPGFSPEPYRALPKPKKPGFFDPLYLDTDILAKTRFLTRAVSRSAQTKETARSHPYQKPNLPNPCHQVTS